MIDGQFGIRLSQHGVGLARISIDPGETVPRLSVCRFIPNTTLADRPSLLGRLSEELGLHEAYCISVAEDDMFTLLLVDTPEVDPGELKSAIRWRIKDLIDFHVDDAIVDVFDIPGQEERGRQKLMYVVAARRAAVQAYINQLEDERINLSVIDIPELAMRNVAGLLPEDEAGVAMLYLTNDSGLLTLTRQKNLYLSRRLDIGLNQLSAFVAEDVEVRHEEDDVFTIDDEVSYARPLIRAFDNIVLEVQRSLDYYESHFALPPVSALILAPMEDHIPGIDEYLGQHLGLPVQMLDLNSTLRCDQVLSEEMQSLCLLPIGAALRERSKAL